MKNHWDAVLGQELPYTWELRGPRIRHGSRISSDEGVSFVCSTGKRQYSATSRKMSILRFLHYLTLLFQLQEFIVTQY
jgi:hypothetical protein